MVVGQNCQTNYNEWMKQKGDKREQRRFETWEGMIGFNVIVVAVCTFSNPNNFHCCQVTAMAESWSKKQEEEEETERHGEMKWWRDEMMSEQSSESKWGIL